MSFGVEIKTMKKIINFLKFDLWSYMNGNPKCDKGGYCNTETERNTTKVIEDINRHKTILSVREYSCSKCGRSITDYFNNLYWFNLSKDVKRKTEKKIRN